MYRATWCRITAVTLIVVVAGVSQAWGQSVNTFPLTGKAGIGTTTPSTSLSILGADPGPSMNTLGVRVENAGTFSIGLFVSGNRGTIGSTNATPLDFISNGLTPRMTLDTTGQLGIGTRTPNAALDVVGNVQASGNLAVGGNIAAKYQDVAEWVRAPRQLTPGTVVIIDSVQYGRVLEGAAPYDTRVAGVISDRPGVLLGEEGTDKVKVAHSGRVRVKVDATFGAITTGDLLVTSSTPGFAMRSTPVDMAGTPIHRPGTLLGKALEPLENGQGEILVLLMLQ
jgi:hypothetical protein